MTYGNLKSLVSGSHSSVLYLYGDIFAAVCRTRSTGIRCSLRTTFRMLLLLLGFNVFNRVWNIRRNTAQQQSHAVNQCKNSQFKTWFKLYIENISDHFAKTLDKTHWLDYKPGSRDPILTVWTPHFSTIQRAGTSQCVSFSTQCNSRALTQNSKFQNPDRSMFQNQDGDINSMNNVQLNNKSHMAQGLTYLLYEHKPATVGV